MILDLLKMNLKKDLISKLENKMIELKKKYFLSNSKEYLDEAYEISFEQMNPEYVYKFSLDSSQFIKEIFYKRAEKFESSVSEIFTTEIRQSNEKMKYKINEIVKKNFYLNANKLFSVSDICDVFISEFEAQQQLNDIKNKFKETPSEVIDIKKFYQISENFEWLSNSIFIKIGKKIINEEEKIALGCEVCCPLCFAKCNREWGENHNQHYARHLLMRFGGNKTVNNKISTRFCLKDAKQYEPISYKSGGKYKTLIDLISIDYPEWVDDFKTYKKDINLENIFELQTKMWFMVKLPLLKAYNLEDTVDFYVEYNRYCDERWKKKIKTEALPRNFMVNSYEKSFL